MKKCTMCPLKTAIVGKLQAKILGRTAAAAPTNDRTQVGEKRNICAQMQSQIERQIKFMKPTSAGAAELHPAALIHCCAVYPGHNLTPIQHPAHFPAPLLALPPSPGVRTFDVLRLRVPEDDFDRRAGIVIVDIASKA
ncbi:unnamed protein product [Ceratitis capitata]|uniref:(Mediterranean fruit fly) hypothetical protein n=1 Tax=Ceratitis capitata TaxID=7213 RepID=A0A811VJ68_CERCA|nr:unnamed protein product [Ceratitis capitata]